MHRTFAHRPDEAHYVKYTRIYILWRLLCLYLVIHIAYSYVDLNVKWTLYAHLSGVNDTTGYSDTRYASHVLWFGSESCAVCFKCYTHKFTIDDTPHTPNTQQRQCWHYGIMYTHDSNNKYIGDRFDAINHVSSWGMRWNDELCGHSGNISHAPFLWITKFKDIVKFWYYCFYYKYEFKQQKPQLKLPYQWTKWNETYTK